MTFRKSFLFLFIVSLLISSLGCEKITNFNSYEEYSFKYIVDLEESDATIEDVKNELINRLNKFNVKNISSDISEQEGDNLITLNFETNDNKEDIELILSNINLFEIKTPLESDEDFENAVVENAKKTLEEIQNGMSFEKAALKAMMINPERVIYDANGDWINKNKIKEAFVDKAFSLEPGEIYSEVIEYTEYPLFAEPVNVSALLKLYDKRENETTIEYPRQVKVRHILIAYEGSLGDAVVGKTKEEAKTLVEEIKEKLENGEDFATLAKENSDDFATYNNGGLLDNPAGKDGYVSDFEDAALELTEVGQISDIVETKYGYHIIKAEEIIEPYEETTVTDQAKLGIIFFVHQPNEWESAGINSSHINKSVLMFTEQYEPFITIHLNEEGKKLFTDLTKANIDKILGYFSGNELLMAKTVKEQNQTGKIELLKESSTEKADLQKIKLDLKPLPAPVLLIQR